MAGPLVPIALGVVFAAGAVVLTAAGGVRRSVRGLASEGWDLDPIDPEEHPEELARAADHDQWATQNGFDWVGMYEVDVPNNPPAFLAAWRQHPGHTFFVLYLVANAEAYDFVTIVDEQREVGVTTGSMSQGLLHPAQPPAFKQAFTNCTHDQRLARHRETVRELATKWRCEPKPSTTPLEELFTYAVRCEARRVMSRPAWALRAVFRYFVSRHLAVNKRAKIPDQPVGLDPR